MRATPTDLVKPAELPSPVLLVGPAYSGKSDLANTCLDSTRKAVVIGTGDTSGPSYAPHLKRITALKAARPSTWQSLDAFPCLNRAFTEIAPTADQILVDSINQWLAATIMENCKKYSFQQLYDHLEVESNTFLDQVTSFSAVSGSRLVMVSSELGAGPSPGNPVEQLLRSANGLLNSRLAAVSATVITLTCGIPHLLKCQS